MLLYPPEKEMFGMLINSDWHIHTEYSYDASNPLENIAESSIAQGLCCIGITDHLNFNDEKFTEYVRRSSEAVRVAQKKYSNIILGVELTPIELPEFEYIATCGKRDGYKPPSQSSPYGLELGMTRSQLISLGIRYAIGAAHWRLDVPFAKTLQPDLNACIKEWYRQQMWLACDERVTILGHPWYHGNGIWYDDFSVIPRSMNADIAAAVKENKKYVECNSHFFVSPKTSEKFRHRYAEFLRELFEMNIPITYGSDSHHNYGDSRAAVEHYLRSVGFVEGDISEISENDFWS